MDIIAAVETSYDRIGGLVANLHPAQLDNQTPLPGWDVHKLLDHTLAFVVMLTGTANGAPMPEQPPSELIGDDPAKAVTAAVRDSLETWRRPGALQRSVATPLGPLPGERALALVVMETTVHGTDLARATDQDATIDPQVAAIALATLQSMPLDAIRAAGEFGPELDVGQNASTADRVLALTGRHP